MKPFNYVEIKNQDNVLASGDLTEEELINFGCSLNTDILNEVNRKGYHYYSTEDLKILFTNNPHDIL